MVGWSGRLLRMVVVACATASALPAALAPGAPSAGAVGGLVDQLVLDGFDRPTTVRGLPDGTVVVLEQPGRVRLVRPGAASATTALTLSVCDNSERGLLGVAADPAFVTSGHLYLYSTRRAGDTCVNRVSRFTMAPGGVIDPASEVVLLDNIPSTGANHNGGDLNVGSDGHLYVAVGDAGTDPRGNSGSAGANDAARDLSLLVGKIVRITTSGGVPADNPFANDPAGVDCRTAGVSAPANRRCREIFAWGLRNPYRTPFDPNRNDVRFFINDVGQNTWEEVNEGGLGRDYGWNLREGACVRGSTTNCPPPPASLTDPVTSYSHAATGCTYITGGAFVPNGWWPAEYDGNYLFADGGCRRLFRMTAAGTVDYSTPLATLTGSPTDVAFVAWGNQPSLFYVTQQGQLRRIWWPAPAATDTGPLAFAAVSPLRVFDSRNGTGGGGIGPLRGGTTRLIDVQAPDASVRAALVNVTLTRSTGPAVVALRAPRRAPTTTAAVNASSAGELVANAAIAPVDEAGRVLLATSTTTHVVVDVLGYFRAAPSALAAGRLVPVGPTRLVDTRQSPSAANDFERVAGPIANSATVTVPATGRAGIPPGGVAAVAMVVTGIDRSTGPGVLTVAPAGAPRPLAANLATSAAGDVRANFVVTPLGAGGRLRVDVEGIDDVVVDVVGYVTDATVAASTAGRVVVVAPQRLADTRLGTPFGRLSAGADRTLVPPVPGGSTGVIHNLTITRNDRPTFLTATAAGAPLPLASNVIAVGASQTRAALSVTPTGTGGAVRFRAQHDLDVVVDLAAYLTGS